MKSALYLDTSIISALFDYSKPLRQLITQKWFENEAEQYSPYISVITLKEINDYQNVLEREKRERLIFDYKMVSLNITDSAIELGNEYIEKGAIPKTEPEDAYHIAIATINNIKNLASWNFKHIVSVNPIRKIHEINLKRNLPLIEIGTLEFFGGAKYGNL